MGACEELLEVRRSVTVGILSGIARVEGIEAVQELPGVGHAVAIVIEIGVVPGAVAVRVHRFRGIVGEGICAVRHAVGIVVEVGIVPHTVAIEVGPLVRVGGKRVGRVGDAVAVAVSGMRAGEKLGEVRERVAIGVQCGIAGIEWVEAVEDLPGVGHPVAIVVEVGIVPDTVAIGIARFSGVVGEGVFEIRDAVAIVVDFLTMYWVPSRVERIQAATVIATSMSKLSSSGITTRSVSPSKSSADP